MKNKNTTRIVLRYISRHSFLIIFLILFSLIVAIASLFIPIFVGDAIDSAVSSGRVNFDSIKESILYIAVCALTVAVSQWATSVIGNRITFNVVKDIRKDAFDKIQSLPLSYLDTHNHGDTVSRIIADAEQFADGLLMGFTQLFVGITTILGTFAFMLYLGVKITLMVVVLTPISLLLTSYIAKFTFSMFREQSSTRGEVTACIDEYIVNQKIVRAFNYESRAQERFDEKNERLKKASVRAIFYSSLVNPSTRVINNIVYAVVALFGAISVMNGSMTVGGLTCFLSYAGQYAKPFNEISGIIGELQNSLACAGRVLDLIHQEDRAPDGEKILKNPQGLVQFKNVSFSYNKEKSLIENLNLCVKPGMRVAIVGPTGCGKTTLINLIMRFYDVTHGEISIDSYNVEELTRKSLRSNIGMVLQDTWIKKGTVRENIALGRPEASDEEIIAAARASHAHNFIKKLPHGYDTVISNESGDLSQGQRQLLCISRIMLTSPDILILDEATSSIDTRTEMKIQDAFSHLMKGKTSFIVAHRLSTIKEADLILVMKNGNVIEQGNHNELLAKGGFYSELYNSQTA